MLTKLIPGHVANCEFPYVTGRNFHKIILLIFYCCEWKRYEIEAHMGLRFEFLPTRVLDLKKNVQVNFHDIFQFFQILFVNFVDIHLI